VLGREKYYCASMNKNCRVVGLTCKSRRILCNTNFAVVDFVTQSRSDSAVDRGSRRTGV